MNIRFIANGLALIVLVVTGSACSAGAQSVAVEARMDATGESGILHVQKVGDSGPAIILIPGLASGTWVWDDSVARLRKTHRLYLLTLPGFDGRPRQPGVSFDRIIESLHELVSSNKLDHPILIGHSLGGTLSLAFAAAYPGLIAGVITVDGLPVFPGTEAFAGDRGVLAQQMRRQLSGQTREQFAAGQSAFMRVTGVIDPALAAQLAVMTGRSDPEACAEFAAELMAVDLRSQLARIDVPVTVISPYYTPDYSDRGFSEEAKTAYYKTLLSGTKQLNVVSISPARHFVMFDQPAAFAAVVDKAITAMPVQH
jgi:pimeloyl-ACP methyl ester carboxylesterase